MTLASDERGQIKARVPQSVRDTLQQAADLLGVPLKQFIVQAALREAQRVMEHSRVVELSTHDAVLLLRLLDKAPKPNARLAEALKNYKSRTLDAANSILEWKSRVKRARFRKKRAQ